MDTRFIAHNNYINNSANISCVLLNAVLSSALPRALDSIIYIDDVPTPEQLLTLDFDISHDVPLGDLNFVRDFLHNVEQLGHDVADANLTPLEVPPAIQKYINREYVFLRGKDIPEIMLNSQKYFIKDASHLKKWNSLIYDGDITGFIEPETMYVLTEKVIFLSEWRVFVHRGEIEGTYNYLGDPAIFPDTETLYDMISELSESHSPKSYTLDVGIVSYDGKRKTEPIEVHPFVACGLYGFSDLCLPRMLEDGYKWYLQEA